MDPIQHALANPIDDGTRPRAPHLSLEVVEALWRQSAGLALWQRCAVRQYLARHALVRGASDLVLLAKALDLPPLDPFSAVVAWGELERAVSIFSDQENLFTGAHREPVGLDVVFRRAFGRATWEEGAP